MQPDLRILEDKTWWVPVHPFRHADGAALFSGFVCLIAARAPPNPMGVWGTVLIFEDRTDAQEYLDLYSKKLGGDGPDMTGIELSFEPTWDGFVIQGLSADQVQNTLIDQHHVPIVVHHAWAGSVLKKLKNNGLPASTLLATQRHAQLAQRLHSTRGI